MSALIPKQGSSRISKLLFLLGSAVFLYPFSAEAETQNVFIRSVSIGTSNANEDFVEIKNGGDCAINLMDWKLHKRTASGTESSIKVLSGTRAILPPDTSFLWANSSNGFATSLNADNTSTATISANNALALFDTNDTLIDSLAWGTISKPFREEATLLANPTIGEMIARDTRDADPEIRTFEAPKNNANVSENISNLCGISTDLAHDSKIILSEILANPSGDENENEFIELENTSTSSKDLSGWKLRDSSKTGVYIFPKNTTLLPDEFFVIYRSNFSFALNNGTETLSLLDGKDTLADTVSWKIARENISLARDGARWRNTKTLTPGAKNIFGNDPEASTKIPKKGYAKIPLEFSVKAKDKDGDPTKVTWNFGDGHKSYKSKTTHTFEKTGTYRASVTVTDGVADTTKTFSIKIEKYHAPEVRIVSIIPNPEGRDTDPETGEYLLIENRSKKSVNLKGWSIATGASKKKLVNHPVREDFIIPSGATKKLVRGNSLFSLGNAKAVIELRDPRKKRVQEIHYKYTSGKSAPDNAEYFKDKGKSWAWRFASITESSTEPPSTTTNPEKTSEGEIPDNTPTLQGASTISSNSVSLNPFPFIPFFSQLNTSVSSTSTLSLDETHHYRFTREENPREYSHSRIAELPNKAASWLNGFLGGFLR